MFSSICCVLWPAVSRPRTWVLLDPWHWPFPLPSGICYIRIQGIPPIRSELPHLPSNHVTGQGTNPRSALSEEITRWITTATAWNSRYPQQRPSAFLRKRLMHPPQKERTPSGKMILLLPSFPKRNTHSGVSYTSASNASCRNISWPPCMTADYMTLHALWRLLSW